MTKVKNADQSTLADGIKFELERNRELLSSYKEIGAAGVFGAANIEANIKAAEDAMLEGDLVAMIKAYQALEANN